MGGARRDVGRHLGFYFLGFDFSGNIRERCNIR